MSPEHHPLTIAGQDTGLHGFTDARLDGWDERVRDHPALDLVDDLEALTGPEGLEDVSKFPNLTRALLEKGYTADDIRKIYGGNLLRVMRAVESHAARK